MKTVWKTHFKGIFSAKNETRDDKIYTEENWIIEDTSTIMKSETEQNLKSHANNKAPGVDEVPKELLEAGGEVIARWLHKICQDVVKAKGIVENGERQKLPPFIRREVLQSSPLADP